MSRPIYEPTAERTDAALGYDKAQLQRRPAPTGSGSVQWIRMSSVTLQTIPSSDSAGIVYPDAVVNNYPAVFTHNLSGGEPFSVQPLITGLYQATVRVNITNEPLAGFSLELLGTDYLEGLSGYHSVYYPGYQTGGVFPPPSDGLPFTSAVWEKIDHMFMAGPTFFAGNDWEIEAFITTAGDAIDIAAATIEVRRIGDVDFFPYADGS